jgi:hypothetical protein
MAQHYGLLSTPSSLQQPPLDLLDTNRVEPLPVDPLETGDDVLGRIGAGAVVARVVSRGEALCNRSQNGLRRNLIRGTSPYASPTVAFAQQAASSVVR